MHAPRLVHAVVKERHIQQRQPPVDTFFAAHACRRRVACAVYADDAGMPGRGVSEAANLPAPQRLRRPPAEGKSATSRAGVMGATDRPHGRIERLQEREGESGAVLPCYSQREGFCRSVSSDPPCPRAPPRNQNAQRVATQKCKRVAGSVDRRYAPTKFFSFAAGRQRAASQPGGVTCCWRLQLPIRCQPPTLFLPQQ